MTGKATAVFWIGLILIFVNFWLSGQSTVVWKLLTTGSAVQLGNVGKGKPSKPGSHKGGLTIPLPGPNWPMP